MSGGRLGWLLGALAACQPDLGPFEISLDPVAELDGAVDRAGGVDRLGATMAIGRGADGLGTRGFLAFDLVDVMPDDDLTVVVDRAILQLVESAADDGVFDELGSAFVEIVDPGSALDAADFDAAPLVDAGVAATGSMTDEPHTIDVTLAVGGFFDDGIRADVLPFRVRFPFDDDGVAGSDPAQWQLFTAEAPEGMRPLLELDYRLEIAR